MSYQGYYRMAIRCIENNEILAHHVPVLLQIGCSHFWNWRFSLYERSL